MQERRGRLLLTPVCVVCLCACEWKTPQSFCTSTKAVAKEKPLSGEAVQFFCSSCDLTAHLCPRRSSWPKRLLSHHALSHDLGAHCTLQKYHLAQFEWKRKWIHICALPFGSPLKKFQVCEFTGDVSKGEKSIDLNLL